MAQLFWCRASCCLILAAIVADGSVFVDEELAPCLMFLPCFIILYHFILSRLQAVPALRRFSSIYFAINPPSFGRPFSIKTTDKCVLQLPLHLIDH
jgi:membrane protein YdbS with pleckstrin-like domain